jgi:hypothetical protein
MKLRRAFIVVLAAALSLGGVGRSNAAYEHCADAGPALAVEHGNDHAHTNHGMDHDDMATAHQPEDSTGQAAEKCAKCCGVCVAAPTIAVNAPATPVAPNSSSIYLPADMAAVGHILLLDPGIPKRS